MKSENHSIELGRAVELTTRWRERHPQEIKGGWFDRAAFDRLLAQQGVAGIRIYLGEKDDGSWTYVMVATTGDGKDIIPALSKNLESGEGTGIEEEAIPCPPLCDCESPLNGECPPQ